MMDVAMTVMYVVMNVLIGVAGLVLFIFLCASICCGVSMEAQRATEALEERWSSAALPAPVEMELVRPVAPAPAVVTKNLGYFPYSAEGRRASENLVCAICLEVFEHGAECSEVPACRHLFHRDCVGAWMKTNTTCPLCRRQIVAGSERLSAAEEMV